MKKKVSVRLFIRLSVAGILLTLLGMLVCSLYCPDDLLLFLPAIILAVIALVGITVCLVWLLNKKSSREQRRLKNELFRMKLLLKDQLEISEIKQQVMHEILISKEK